MSTEDQKQIEKELKSVKRKILLKRIDLGFKMSLPLSFAAVATVAGVLAYSTKYDSETDIEEATALKKQYNHIEFSKNSPNGTANSIVKCFNAGIKQNKPGSSNLSYEVTELPDGDIQITYTRPQIKKTISISIESLNQCAKNQVQKKHKRIDKTLKISTGISGATFIWFMLLHTLRIRHDKKRRNELQKKLKALQPK